MLKQLKEKTKHLQTIALGQYRALYKNYFDLRHTIDTASQALRLDRPSFSQLLPYRYYDEKHEIFINSKTLGFGFELGILCGADEKLIQSINDILRLKLPDDYDLQCLLWGSHHVGDQLDQLKNVPDYANPLMANMLDNAVSYYVNGARQGFKNPRELPLTLRDYRCFWFLSTPQALQEDSLLALLTVRSQLEIELKSANLQAKRVNSQDFFSLIQAVTQFSLQCLTPAPVSYNKLDELHQQLIDVSFEMSHEPHHLDMSYQTEEGSCKTRVVNLSVKKYPEKFALWQGADNICNVFRKAQAITCPFIISIHVRLIAHEKAKSLAQQQFMKFKNRASKPIAHYVSGTQDQHQAWYHLKEQLHTDQAKLATVFFNLLLFSDEQNAALDESNAISCFRYNGFELKKAPFLQLQSFLSTLPFTVTEGLYQDLANSGRLNRLTTWNIANLMPLIGDFKGSRNGMVIPSFRHQLSFFDPFDERLPIDNYNLAIAATSGSGKSFFTQQLIMTTLTQGGYVWVIDVGESYKNLCHSLQGIYLTAENLRLNPFSNVVNIEESCEQIRDLFAVMASPHDKLDDVQYAYLLEAVKAAFALKQQKTNVDDVIAYLQRLISDKPNARLEDLCILLNQFSSTGINAQYFCEAAILTPDARFVVLELGELKNKPQLLKAVLFALILYIEQRMYHMDRSIRKLCVLDEAWRFMSGDNSVAARFIEEGYRTVRKHFGSFCTIVQSVKDFHESREAQAAWHCSDIKVIMRQNDKAFKEFCQENANFYTAYEEAMIKGFNEAAKNGFSEFMLCLGKMTSFHRLLVDPFTRIMFSTRGKDVAKLTRLQKEEGMSLERAIEYLARERFPDEFQLGVR